MSGVYTWFSLGPFGLSLPLCVCTHTYIMHVLRSSCFMLPDLDPHCPFDRPTSLSVLFAYHTNPSTCCRWILRYSFSRASLLSFPLFFISLPPIPDALSIQLIPMCGYHSQSLCIHTSLFFSYIFFLFRCRWYMISLSILSVVSNIKLSFCRLLHTEATIVLSATIYLFLVMVVFLGRVFSDARSLSLLWFLCLSWSFFVPSGWSVPLVFSSYFHFIIILRALCSNYPLV